MHCFHIFVSQILSRLHSVFGSSLYGIEFFYFNHEYKLDLYVSQRECTCIISYSYECCETRRIHSRRRLCIVWQFSRVNRKKSKPSWLRWTFSEKFLLNKYKFSYLDSYLDVGNTIIGKMQFVCVDDNSTHTVREPS